MKTNFHCRKVNGEANFLIDDWNEAFDYCIKNNLSEKEMDEILNHPSCEKQCFECMADVGQTRLKTKQLIQNLK
jgi:hypothetical protein